MTSTALASQDNHTPPVLVPNRSETPQEQRNYQVSRLFESAYQKASTLQLSDEEIEQLRKPFADEEIQIHANGYCYVEHMSIRERLNDVLGPGQWCHLERWHSTELIEAPDPKDNCIRVYCSNVLLIRGHLVGETVTDGTYYPKNKRGSMSDALESAMSDGLRRIAAKHLGCGSQVWLKNFTEDWKQKYATQKVVDKGPLVWVRKDMSGNPDPMCIDAEVTEPAGDPVPPQDHKVPTPPPPDTPKPADPPPPPPPVKPAPVQSPQSAQENPFIGGAEQAVIAEAFKGKSEQAKQLLAVLGYERFGLIPKTRWRFVELCINYSVKLDWVRGTVLEKNGSFVPLAELNDEDVTIVTEFLESRLVHKD